MADPNKQLIEALAKNAYLNTLALQALYRREQLKESDKVPPNWEALTVLVPGLVAGQTNPRPINVFPRNIKRSGFSLYNIGTSAILFSGLEFDITETNQQLTGQGQGVIKIGQLAAGQQISIVSSGPLYVAPATANATTLTIIETLFLETTRDTSKDELHHGGYHDRMVDIDITLQSLQKDLV